MRNWPPARGVTRATRTYTPIQTGEQMAPEDHYASFSVMGFQRDRGYDVNIWVGYRHRAYVEGKGWKVERGKGCGLEVVIPFEAKPSAGDLLMAVGHTLRWMALQEEVLEMDGQDPLFDL